MDHAEALQHLRTLINVASESEDLDTIYKHLRMMRNIVNKALPVRAPPRRRKPRADNDQGPQS